MNAEPKVLSRSVPSTLDERVDAILRVKEGPCISVVLPLETKSAARSQNAMRIEHAVQRAIRSLTSASISERQYRELTRELKNLAASIDPNHVKEGLGLFVSTTVSERIDFPFPVTECIQVDNSFETRDLYYAIQYNRSYHILSMSKHSIHLFVAQAEAMHEIRDGYFPRTIRDMYEYARPSRANSYSGTLKAFEKDKSMLSEVRVFSHLKKAAENLSKYLGDHHAEIVLAGSAKLVHVMENQHAIARHVIGHVQGTFDPNEHAQLARQAWKVCHEYRQSEIHQLIKTAGEATLTFRRRGIRSVWESASQGKGLLLLVERNLRCRAYLPEGSNQIRLRPPKGRFRVLEDAVDDVIELVVQKGGRVVFVPENALSKFERIVLVLRYP